MTPAGSAAAQALAGLLAQFRTVLASPSQAMPGETVRAALLPGDLDPRAIDPLAGSLSLVGVAKALPFSTAALPALPALPAGPQPTGADGVAAAIASLASEVQSTVLPGPAGGSGGLPPGAKAIGSVGEMVAGFSLPLPQAKVTVAWRVTTVPDPGAPALEEGHDFVAMGGLGLPQVELLFPPVLQELTFRAIAAPKPEMRYLWADVTVRLSGEPASARLGPIPVTLLPLLLPTSCVLFRHPGYTPVWEGKADGCAVIVVPRDSPLTQASDLMDEYRKVAATLGKVRRLAGRFAALAQLLFGIDTLGRALASQPKVALLAGDLLDGVPDLGVVKLNKRYGLDWMPTAGHAGLEEIRDTSEDDATFHNRASSMMLIAAPGTRVACHNYEGYETVRSGKAAGHFTLETGLEALVLLPRLHEAKPDTLPRGRMVEHQPNDLNGKMFGNTLSSVRFLKTDGPVRLGSLLDRLPGPGLPSMPGAAPARPAAPPKPAAPSKPAAAPKLPRLPGLRRP